MITKNRTNYSSIRSVPLILIGALSAICLMGIWGCGQLTGYSNKSLFPEDISSIYVEMFDNRTFRRDVEYKLTDALAKRIEAQTPYKICSKDAADTILTGQIVSIGEALLSSERQTARPLEKEARLAAVVNWKNLKTGRLLLDNKTITAAASYSEWQNQGFGYGSALAANKLAERIVELMEKQW
ncbi:MAG: LptE family protein [Sedimentisphaerales bacterium]|nr:LptE family protein [Sedimentisphaerales bacterium]